MCICIECVGVNVLPRMNLDGSVVCVRMSDINMLKFVCEDRRVCTRCIRTSKRIYLCLYMFSVYMYICMGLCRFIVAIYIYPVRLYRFVAMKTYV